MPVMNKTLLLLLGMVASTYADAPPTPETPDPHHAAYYYDQWRTDNPKTRVTVYVSLDDGTSDINPADISLEGMFGSSSDDPSTRPGVEIVEIRKVSITQHPDGTITEGGPTPAVAYTVNLAQSLPAADWKDSQALLDFKATPTQHGIENSIIPVEVAAPQGTVTALKSQLDIPIISAPSIVRHGESVDIMRPLLAMHPDDGEPFILDEQARDWAGVEIDYSHSGLSSGAPISSLFNIVPGFQPAPEIHLIAR